MLKKFCLFLFPAILFSCIIEKVEFKTKGDVRLTQVEFSDLKNWQEIDYSGALKALNNSCNKISKLPQNRTLGGSIADIKYSNLRDICEIAFKIKDMSDLQIKNFFENWFRPFLVSDKNSDDEGLFTGYYEPELEGSYEKNEIYKYAIYKKPGNSNFTRQEIEEGAIDDKGLEILYVNDNVELFFAHIQGSMKIKMPDESFVRLSVSGSNNKKFTPIANLLIENNYIARGKISPNSIKEFLKNNDDIAQAVMNVNERYIFYKISNYKNPIGSSGSELVAEHSIAIDNAIIPYGLPIFIETKSDYQQLLIAQDSGEAIKGAVRGDIFFGSGNKASSMFSKGKYYILLPNNLN